MTYWLNGQFFDDDVAAVGPRDRGLTLGDGIFETLRIKGGRPLAGLDHMARLEAAAKALKLPIPGDPDTLLQAMTRLAAQTHQPEGALRLTVTRGASARGLALPDVAQPQVMMTLSPLPPQRNTPVRVRVIDTPRRNEHSPISRFKTLNYLDNVLAFDAARALGGDDALMKNTAGRLVGGAYSNLFVSINGTLATPPLSDGVRDGVMRARVIERIGAVEKSIWPEDVARVEEAMLTNALGIRPILSSDQKKLSAGPMVQTAQPFSD